MTDTPPATPQAPPGPPAKDHGRAGRDLPAAIGSAVVLLGARALARLLRTVVVFRGRHLGLARRAYQAELRLYPVGSGGASVQLLRQVIDLTRRNANLVHQRCRVGGDGEALTVPRQWGHGGGYPWMS